MLDGILEAIGSMDKRLQIFQERMEQRFALVDQRFGEMDRRFGEIDRRFGEVDRRLGDIDRRLERVDVRMDVLDMKQTRQFQWLVGLLLGTLIAVIGAFGGVIATLLNR